MENVWEFLRANFFSQRIYKAYHTIFEACQRVWNTSCRCPTALPPMGSIFSLALLGGNAMRFQPLH